MLALPPCERRVHRVTARETLVSKFGAKHLRHELFAASNVLLRHLARSCLISHWYVRHEVLVLVIDQIRRSGHALQQPKNRGIGQPEVLWPTYVHDRLARLWIMRRDAPPLCTCLHDVAPHTRRTRACDGMVWRVVRNEHKVRCSAIRKHAASVRHALTASCRCTRHDGGM